jgi:hypothetical protein
MMCNFACTGLVGFFPTLLLLLYTCETTAVSNSTSGDLGDKTSSVQFSYVQRFDYQPASVTISATPLLPVPSSPPPLLLSPLLCSPMSLQVVQTVTTHQAGALPKSNYENPLVGFEGVGAYNPRGNDQHQQHLQQHLQHAGDDSAFATKYNTLNDGAVPQEPYEQVDFHGYASLPPPAPPPRLVGICMEAA